MLKFPQHVHERVEAIVPDVVRPLRLQRAQGSHDRVHHLVAALGQVDQPAVGATWCATFEIAKLLKLADQVVGRLPRHADLPGELGQPDPVGRRPGKDHEMCILQVGEAGGTNVLVDAGPGALPGDAK